MRKCLYAAIMLILISICTFAQEDQSYQNYVQSLESSWEEYSEAKAFEEFKRQQDAAFQAFAREQEEAYRKYVQEIERKWNEFIGSTSREWVEYSEDKSVRSIVNFEEKEEKTSEKIETGPAENSETESKSDPGEKPESVPEQKPELKPEMMPDVKPEEDIKDESGEELKLKPEVTPEVEIDGVNKIKPEQKPEMESDMIPKTEPKPKVETKPEVKPKPESEPELTVAEKLGIEPKESEAKPEIKSETIPKPKVKSEERPEVKLEEKNRTVETPEVKVEVSPEGKSESTPAAKLEVETREKLNAEPEPGGKGSITVQAVVPADEPDAVDKAKGMIAGHIERIFSPKNDARRSVLEGQVKTRTGEIVTPKNVRDFVQKEVLPKAKAEPELINSSDGVNRVKVSVVIPMVPEHLKIRAGQYLRSTRKYCSQYKEDLPLVMAIIQTESYFNPLAKSHIPAYGLMQIVPRYAGKDAYKHVFKKDEEPEPKELYVPDMNLLLGVAYLRILRDSYFYGIKDPKKQEYLVIASYNGGMGRVIRKVLKKYDIPRMSQSEVYEALREEMPDETKDYLAKVTSRQKNYLAWQ